MEKKKENEENNEINNNNSQENSSENVLKKILLILESYIDNNLESKEKLEKTLCYILDCIENIIQGNYVIFSNSEYLNIIKELEIKLKEYIEREKQLIEENSILQFEIISCQKILEQNKTIKKEEYELIIKKLKKKFQEEKSLYKLNEIRYFDKIKELTKINRDLNKKIEELESEKLEKKKRTISALNKKNNNFQKGNSSMNIFHKNTSFDINNSIKTINESFDFYKKKVIDFKSKNSLQNRFRLYKYYQKNKNTDLQNKFFINQNYDKFNYIINNNNKHIKHLLPRNPFDRKEKHYYSAFLKY